MNFNDSKIYTGAWFVVSVANGVAIDFAKCVLPGKLMPLTFLTNENKQSII